MSLVSFVILLLLLICIDSPHKCNARNILGAVSKENRENKLPLPSKHDDKASLVKVSVTTKSKPNTKGPIEDNMVKQTRVDKNDQKSKSSKAKELESKGAKHSNSKQDDIVSISWREPSNQRGEKRTGFNLDYSSPQEHPGQHN